MGSIMAESTHPLPGLLDDPQFHLKDFPSRSSLHIAPLRNPVPSRTSSIPLPLEPQTPRDGEARSSKAKLDSQTPMSKGSGITPPVSPADIIRARDSRRPTAISELVDSVVPPSLHHPTAQLPSFVSLAVVEKSFLPPYPRTGQSPPAKRPRLDQDIGLNEDYIHLPRPAQNTTGQRPPPLLPAILNGLHEPPPNAALLPPMELEAQRLANENGVSRVSQNGLQPRKSLVRPPEKMINSPEIGVAGIPPRPVENIDIEVVGAKVTNIQLTGTTKYAQRLRKPPRKWTDAETAHLIQGVEKHGFGKWKIVLDDPTYQFDGRSAVDLKDRYRIYSRGNARNVKCLNKEPPPEPLSHSSPGVLTCTESEGVAIGEQQIHPDTTPNDPSRKGVDSSTGKKGEKRVRRVWSAEEDENLIKGVSKHGFQWTLIHDDPELSLAHRKATDLRDRIRTKYPDGYRNAESAPLSSRTKGSRRTAAGAKATGDAGIKSAATTGAQEQSFMSRSAHTKTAIAPPADQAHELPGMTLPSLTKNDGDLDWGDNTLPPLLDWEEMGI